MRFSLVLSVMMAGTAMCSPVDTLATSSISNPEIASKVFPERFQSLHDKTNEDNSDHVLISFHNGEEMTKSMMAVLDQLNIAMRKNDQEALKSLIQQIQPPKMEKLMFAAIGHYRLYDLFNRLLDARFKLPVKDARAEDKTLSNIFEHIVCKVRTRNAGYVIEIAPNVVMPANDRDVGFVTRVVPQLLRLGGISSSSLHESLQCAAAGGETDLVFQIVSYIKQHHWLIDENAFIQAIRQVPQRSRVALKDVFKYYIKSMDWFPTWTDVFEKDSTFRLESLQRDILDYEIKFKDEQYVEIFAKMVNKYPLETIKKFGIFWFKPSISGHEEFIYEKMIAGIVKAYRTTSIPQEKFSPLLYDLAKKFGKSIDQVKDDVRRRS